MAAADARQKLLQHAVKHLITKGHEVIDAEQLTIHDGRISVMDRPEARWARVVTNGASTWRPPAH